MSTNPFDKFSKKNGDVVVVAPEPQPVKKVEVVQEDARPTVLLSEIDAHIHERMKAQPKTLEEVDIKVEPKRGDGKHRLSLPDELVPYLTRYAFRWIFKSSRALDEACNVRGWVLVNRSHFPELPSYRLSVNGGVERGDNILAFMPKAKAEALRAAPGIRSKEMVTSTFEKHKDNPDFYKPTDSEDERVIMI